MVRLLRSYVAQQQLVVGHDARGRAGAAAAGRAARPLASRGASPATQLRAAASGTPRRARRRRPGRRLSVGPPSPGSGAARGRPAPRGPRRVDRVVAADQHLGVLADAWRAGRPARRRVVTHQRAGAAPAARRPGRRAGRGWPITTAIGGSGARPSRARSPGRPRPAAPGAYSSARAVPAPTRITSASARSRAKTRWSAADDSPPACPSASAMAPSSAGHEVQPQPGALGRVGVGRLEVVGVEVAPAGCSIRTRRSCHRPRCRFRRSCNALPRRYAPAAVTVTTAAGRGVRRAAAPGRRRRPRTAPARYGPPRSSAPSGSDTATAPASSASSAARSGRKPGARKNEPDRDVPAALGPERAHRLTGRRRDWRRRTRSAPAAGAGSPRPGPPAHAGVGHRVGRPGGGEHQRVELADPRLGQRRAQPHGRARRGSRGGRRAPPVVWIRMSGCGRPASATADGTSTLAW